MKAKIVFVLLLFSLGLIRAQDSIINDQQTIALKVNRDGTAENLSINTLQKTSPAIQFRTDSLSGPSIWLNKEKIKLSATKDNLFTGQAKDVKFSLQYITTSNRLGIEITAISTSPVSLHNVNLSLVLGINTELKKYPDWRDQFFPTLMRAEKTHFWGYLMTPNGRIVTVASPDPIASYTLHYNNSKNIFDHGHLIRTVSLNLLHPGPLPKRHPTNSSLLPGETKKWRFYLQESPHLESVPGIVQKNTQAPMVKANLYTLHDGEKSKITIFSTSPPSIQMILGENKSIPLSLQKQNGYYEINFSPSKEGIYTLHVTDPRTKKISEAKFTCISQNYSDYIKSARRAAIKYAQIASSHTEGWYGLFSGYIAKEKFPEAAEDQKIDEKFNEIYPLMYDSITNIPVHFMERIQNHAMMAALFAQKYKASKDIRDLKRASDLADYILSKQSPDGAYRNGHTHYTSVIYIAKAIMEVMEQEKTMAAASEFWAYQYKKHFHSVKKAIDDLSKNLDNIQTEGEMTFEDGMISCSYTQISQFALLLPESSPERAKYIAAAEKLVELHQCLSQLLVPDSRMNGASLRFWEAQYDILSGPNMMNSPHGWSAWQIYGLKNLYELTGKYMYLEQMMNAIGTCIQLLDPKTDTLNWAFITDPYIVSQYFTKDPKDNSKGIYEKKIIGERYLPMIGDWYRAKPNTLVTGYWGYDGGKCDNDVHEIFKCLNEILLNNAYVIEKEDGSIIGFNCKVQRTANTVIVTPREPVVTHLHYNMKNPVQIKFNNKVINVTSQSKGWM
ncbi:hypothetical protein C1637_14085 [Chryseobacterium lactis]|uniref:Alpha-L-rhamnosidase six-hairpin glycosidase domain-containing protein n=1 Tax=Chryseobacterium lactis TaxID=1241981 RepID=A0A3G6RQ34_CHRLC|nr:hypothetical protein [Chryseobacterium lactis]AZA83749.1 hypothetical protein EG342_18480 [Chryseobacterium lactis]AZB04134.1 hypothetical protein EG341_09355 [Chryseobacterium lactis]PNW12957.1 hypothetical protein C1637_14085 [Chryseobacterium lactis]